MPASIRLGAGALSFPGRRYQARTLRQWLLNGETRYSRMLRQAMMGWWRNRLRPSFSALILISKVECLAQSWRPGHVAAAILGWVW